MISSLLAFLVVSLFFFFRGLACTTECNDNCDQSIEQSGARHAINLYGGKFTLEHTQTPNKYPYLLLNLPYYLGSTLPKYLEWILAH